MNTKIMLLITVVVVSLALIVIKKPSFGIDFSGGYSIKLKLDHPVDTDQMNQIISILQNRLNSYGLSDIRIKPYGNQFIEIEMSENNKTKVEKLIDVLKKQGNLEAIMLDKNGKSVVIFSGSDLVSIDKPTPYIGYNNPTYAIPIVLKSNAAEKFAKYSSYDNPYGDRIYLFLDRPKNAVIYLPENMKDFQNQVLKGKFNINLDQLEKIANIKIITNLNDLYKIKNKTIIIPSNVSINLSILKDNGNKVKIINNDEEYIIKASGIKSSLGISPEIRGKPEVQAIITIGGTTINDAKENAEETYIVLKSGKLPVKFDDKNVIISSVSPTLGKMFVFYSMLILILAILFVSVLIYLKYKEIKITSLIVLTSVCEIIIIFGLASLISWQLDIPSIAGIIMAVGTGVDQQIVIADEYLKRRKTKTSMSIIFTSVFTTISAMFPLLFISVGTVKGFALTTILGSLIGVLITRPAFAEIIKKFV